MFDWTPTSLIASSPLQVSQGLLSLVGTQLSVAYQERIPANSAVLVVSNHRSFLDPLILMVALNRPVRFATHHYMGQVPILREIVAALGCFPLGVPGKSQKVLFRQATRLLQEREAVGIFPEGAGPMIQLTEPHQICPFHRGFIHLALRAPIQNLAILPVAIASTSETTELGIPLQLFSWFDPSEPLFNQPGWHPLVMYHHVKVMIGCPIWVTDPQRQQYRGKQASTLVSDLAFSCQSEIERMLGQVYSQRSLNHVHCQNPSQFLNTR